MSASRRESTRRPTYLRDASKHQRELPSARTEPGDRPFYARCRDTIVGDGTAKAVYMALASHCQVYVGEGKQGVCRVGQSRLVTVTEFSRRTVQRAVGFLERAGFVGQTPTGRSTRYEVRAGVPLVAKRQGDASQPSEASDRRIGSASETHRKRQRDASTEGGSEGVPEAPPSDRPCATEVPAEAPRDSAAPLRAAPLARSVLEQGEGEGRLATPEVARTHIERMRRDLECRGLFQRQRAPRQSPAMSPVVENADREPDEATRRRAREIQEQFDLERPVEKEPLYAPVGDAAAVRALHGEESPQAQRHCSHPRRMGGVCDLCGHSEGAGFTRDPDTRSGNAHL